MAVLAGCIAKAAHGVVMVDRKCCYYCLANVLRGGVCRMRDDRGLPVGPYRVWLQERGYPGLAMSRAIGDGLASLYALPPGPPQT